VIPGRPAGVSGSALACAALDAGLLTNSLQRLEGQDFGFKQDRRTVVSVNPRLAGYRTRQVPLLYRRIHDSVTAVPGVASMALCLYSPQQGGAWGSGVFVDGQPAPGPGVDNSAAWNRVSAGYLDVIGTPLVRGRGITEQDTAASRHVAVVNQAFARKYFPNEDPIGRHFGRTPGGSREFEIVGWRKTRAI
jgi:hypothetical protein